MNKNFRYNHFGLPSNKKSADEIYIKEYDVYVVVNPTDNEFRVEWVRFGSNCPFPQIIKELPHVGFEVDDINEAVKGREVLFGPDSPNANVTIAFVLDTGVPVELLQFSKQSK